MLETNIEQQAKRIAKLLKQFDALDYSPEDRKKAAMVIGARLLSITKELTRIGEYIDPNWRPEGGVGWNLEAMKK